MTKSFHLVIIFTLVSARIYAQKNFEPETHLGIKLGFNNSSVRFDPTVEQNFRQGFIGGISFKHIEQKNLGIQVELNFLQAGWGENLDDGTDYRRRLNYMQLPVMTHVNFGDQTKFFLNIGPYVGYLLSENESTNSFSKADTSDYYGTKVQNRFDFGLTGGLGVSKSTLIGQFQLEGRGTFGLTSLYEIDRENDLASSQNLMVEISLTYFIDPKLLYSKSRKTTKRVSE